MIRNTDYDAVNLPAMASGTLKCPASMSQLREVFIFLSWVIQRRDLHRQRMDR